MKAQTIYIAPGNSQCRVYAIPYLMRPGQHPRDLDETYQAKWKEIALLNFDLEPVYIDPAYAHLRDEIKGSIGGTFFEI